MSKLAVLDTKITYAKREGAPFKDEDVEPIGQFLDKHSGKNTREMLEIIKKEKESNPIAKYITWDKGKAATEYQLIQLRQVISGVSIIVHGSSEPIEMRAYYSINSESKKKEDTIYYDASQALSDDFARKQLIERAKQSLQNWIYTYGMIKELDSITRFLKREVG